MRVAKVLDATSDVLSRAAAPMRSVVRTRVSSMRIPVGPCGSVAYGQDQQWLI